MKILIHGKNLELTGALKEYTKSKITKATHHYKDIVNEANIHLSIKKSRGINLQNIEVTIFANGRIIRAEEKSENLYSSIDLVSNKICRQLRKYKERTNHSIHNSKLSRKGFEIDNNENLQINEILKTPSEEILPEPAIKNKYFEMHPISIKEARKNLDLIDHNFYVFRNLKDKELQVIYKRSDGGYGLIQSK